MTMLQFASFDTSFWKVPSLIPKIRISQPQSSSVIFQSSTSKFAENSKKSDRQDQPKITPEKKPEYLFCSMAFKAWSGVFFGIRSHSIFDGIYETYPSQGPPEISNDFSPRGNIQAATFKPLAPPQFLTVLISWLLNREKESPKETWTTPKARSNMRKTWVFETCLRRFWDFTIFSDVHKMYNAKTSSGWNRNVDLMMFFVCFLYVFCAPRCSTSSPTSLLFVVSGAVRLATSGPNPPMTLPRVPEVKATGVQPKGSSTFCSVTRLQWFTLITRSYTNRKQTGSDCPLGLFPTDMCKKVMKMNKTPKLVELCGTPGHLKRKKKPVL